MSDFVDAWQGNKRNFRWQSNRLSAGGQNTGVWYSNIKDGKLYWKGQTTNTESSWWGEDMSLAVNAPGDITIEAELRLKRITGTNRRMGIGVNQGAVPFPSNTTVRYGVLLSWEALLYYYGLNAGGLTPFPGRPAQSSMTPGGSDYILNLRLVRKTGYIFLYGNNTFIGQFAYAPTITTVNIVNVLFTGAQDIDIEGWCHWLKIWPKEVVLGGP